MPKYIDPAWEMKRNYLIERNKVEQEMRASGEWLEPEKKAEPKEPRSGGNAGGVSTLPDWVIDYDALD